MPISKENKARYPKNWKAIRAEVLERAGNRCEWVENGARCILTHGEWGLRDLDGTWWRSEDFANGSIPEMIQFERGDKLKLAHRVCLTIAHLNHIPEDCGEPGNRPNLAAWCEKHHLDYDRPLHMVNSRKTREKKKGQTNLLDVTQK